MKYFFLLAFITSPAFACQARPGQYSYEKSYQLSPSVITAKVLKQESLGDRKYRLTFETTKVWKGKVPAKFTTEYTDNMCAPFGEWARPGLNCLVFLTEKNGIIATPAGSYCDQKGGTDFPEFEKIIEPRK